MTMPIRVRLTLWYIGVLAVVLVAFSAGVVWLQGRFARSGLDTELADVAETTSSVFREELGESHRLARAASETRRSVDVPNRTVAILDAGGHPLAAHWRGFPRSALLVTPATPAFSATLLQDGTPWRIRLTRHQSPDGAYMVFVAASESSLARERAMLVRALAVGLPLALLAAALVCWWAASRALRPLTRMSDDAEQITAQSAAMRLFVPAGHDEIAQLGRAFNRLLDRVAASVRAQRQFMADASHELRTPVTAAHTAADVTLSQAHREEDDYREALAIVKAQTSRLGRMVTDMLLLARADAGGHRLRVVPCDLDEVIEDSVRTVGLLARGRDVRIARPFRRGAVVDGDEAMLRQLVINLLENAVRHAPGSAVTVSCTISGGCAVIAIADRGPGIPAGDRERIFERFVRLDAARGGAAGAGLGLPIARWIAERHGGSLRLDASGPSGSTFVVTMPLAREAGDTSGADPYAAAPAVSAWS